MAASSFAGGRLAAQRPQEDPSSVSSSGVAFGFALSRFAAPRVSMVGEDLPVRQVERLQRRELVRPRGHDLLAVGPAERAHQRVGSHQRGADEAPLRRRRVRRTAGSRPGRPPSPGPCPSASRPRPGTARPSAASTRARGRRTRRRRSPSRSGTARDWYARDVAMCSISFFRSYLLSDRYTAEVIEQVGVDQGLFAITSTGWTMPRPMSRCQRRLAIVRVKRPLSGCVTSSASCSSRFAFGASRRSCRARGRGTSARPSAGRLVAAVDLQRLVGDRRRPGRRRRPASRCR